MPVLQRLHQSTKGPLFSHVAQRNGFWGNDSSAQQRFVARSGGWEEMVMRHHVFHTKHDFTPEFAWAAFQLLAQTGAKTITAVDLQRMGQIIASPVAKRADLHKLLASMQELGLVERRGRHFLLTLAGQCLERNVGRSEIGFRAAIHCLYAWKWIWDGQTDLATPSWSYRTVCREILNAGAIGVEQDDLVLRVVEAADSFGAEKVSFSRSSVHGVAMWLEAQVPPLISRRGSRLFAAVSCSVTATTAQFHLMALSRITGPKAILDSPNLRLLEESWLTSASQVMNTIDGTRESAGLQLVPSSPPELLFYHADSASAEWIHAVGSVPPFVKAPRP
jgi:hypothetical protein